MESFMGEEMVRESRIMMDKGISRRRRVWERRKNRTRDMVAARMADFDLVKSRAR